jgi:hypothetical protein
MAGSMPPLAGLEDKSADGGDDAEYEDRVVVQMRRLGMALKSGDFKKAAEAFRAAHEECASAEPDEDDSAMDE